MYFSLRLSFVLATAAVASAQIRIVDQPALGNFSSLQAAINAAPEGSLLLVEDGTYGAATISNKRLSIVAMPGVIAEMGQLTIENLSTSKRVLIVGLTIQSQNAAGALLDGDSGQVRFQDCVIIGGTFTTPASPDVGAPGLTATSCARLALLGCTIIGGNASNAGGDPGVAGGAGLLLQDTSVALYDSTVRGGKGSDEGNPGGDGGAGCRATGFGLFASGSTIQGGKGGTGDYLGCPEGGRGGDALQIDGAQAHLLDVELIRGPGGSNICGDTAANGQTVVNTNGVLDLITGTSRKLAGASPLSDGQKLQLTVAGVPGDRVFLATSDTASFQYQNAWHGLWLLPPALIGTSRSVGRIGASGTLNFETRLPAAISPHQLAFLQAYCVDAAGAIYLTGAQHVERLDRFGLPDCDSDGENDFLELVEQLAADCDRNLSPDSCDIASGAAQDCDGSGVPDSCEIASGVAHDCNGNGIPDACDISSGAAQDCNGNGRPDTCDLAAGGGSLDVDGNGVPDECQNHAPITFWVDAAAPAGGDGSAAQPFNAIAPAVAAAFHGDIVMIRDGTYVGASNRNIDPHGRDILVRSEHGLAACVLDCQALGRAFYLNSHETAACVFEGLTIRNGRAAASPSNSTEGGAFRIQNADPVIRGCIIEQCKASMGGGVWVATSSAQIRDCAFVQCATLPVPSFLGEGGAVRISGGTASKRPTVIGTTITDCTARTGGGIHVQAYGPVVISHCELRGNSAQTGGAMVAISYGLPFLQMDDCLVAGNSAGSGGAIALGSSVGPVATPSWTFSDCTFAGNSADDGGVFHLWGNVNGVPPLRIHDSILWGNSASSGPSFFHYGGSVQVEVAACDIEGGQASFVFDPTATISWQPSNISADPQFALPFGTDGNPLTFGDNDYRLGATSPCIDASDVALLPPDRADIDLDGDFNETVPLDLARSPRRVDVLSVPDTGPGSPPIPDMGAYEHP